MPRDHGPLRRFFRTPKGLLLIILLILTAIAAPHEGLRAVMPGILIAAAAAGVFDAVMLRIRRRTWDFPSGAVLSVLIIAMVLRAQEHWYVVTATALIAILSKYVLRSGQTNVFNPAALAVVISFYLFHTGQSWWGALPEVNPVAQLVLVAGGVFITDRVNKMPLVLAFLGAYFALFTGASFFRDPQWVAEIFRAPDLQAALYFAFIILTDPPTSPIKYRDQVICGIIVAVVSFGIFEWTGAVYYLLAGVLVGNVWEAWRRMRWRAARTAKVAAATS